MALDSNSNTTAFPISFLFRKRPSICALLNNNID